MHRLFLTQASILISIAILHAAGLFLFLQWYFWWYDIMLHFLGGLWVALMFQWLARTGQYAHSLAATIFAVLFVGLAWEVFEFLVGSPRESRYLFDTSLDIVMDLSGGIVGYVIASWILTRNASK